MPCRYYSTSIFCQIGVEEYISTALVGTLNFLTTFLAIVLVDKVSQSAVHQSVCLLLVSQSVSLSITRQSVSITRQSVSQSVLCQLLTNDSEPVICQSV